MKLYVKINICFVPNQEGQLIEFMVSGSETYCCTHKNVGGVEYVLLTEVDTISSAYNCKNNCIYEKVRDPGRIYCFAPGKTLAAVCQDGGK